PCGQGLADRDDRAGLRVPRREGRRVQRQVDARPGAGAALGAGRDGGGGAARDGGRNAPRADLLLALLRDDWPPRAAHDHRHPDPRLAGLARRPRPLRQRVPYSGGADRAVLALRGHHLDLPVPAALPDRTPLMSSHVVPVRVYIGVFAALLVLTGATVWA